MSSSFYSKIIASSKRKFNVFNRISNTRNLEEISYDINLLIIFFITFVTAYLTLIFFINFINKIGFKPFVIYRIILGFIILILF